MSNKLDMNFVAFCIFLAAMYVLGQYLENEATAHNTKADLVYVKPHRWEYKAMDLNSAEYAEPFEFIEGPIILNRVILIGHDSMTFLALWDGEHDEITTIRTATVLDTEIEFNMVVEGGLWLSMPDPADSSRVVVTFQRI